MVSFGLPEHGNWQKYKRHIRVHETSLVTPTASVNFWTDPQGPEVRLAIGAGSHIYSSFNLLCPDAKIRVGERCQLGNVNFVCSTEIAVGDDVLMAWGINILDSNHHSIYWEERQYDVERCRQDYVASDGGLIGQGQDWSKVGKKRVAIGSKSWIGLNVIILKGVTIGEGAIIAPGSVVTKDVPAWTMAGGNPCREIKHLQRAPGQKANPA